jgi:hypothetical protein
MKVQVREGLADHFIGFIYHARRRPKDVFVLEDEPRRELFPAEKRIVATPEGKATYDAIKDKEGKIPQLFSFRWMEPVSVNARESVSTSQQAMDERSKKIKEERAGQRSLDAGKGEVI